MPVVFLTGATGCVGSRLAVELLQRPDISLCLLVRGNSIAAAEGRLRRILEFWDIEYGNPRIRNRVRVVLGDIAEPRLGIDSFTYERLAAQITHVIHAAADIKLNLTPAEARRLSVGGTREAVALARRCEAKRFVYLSTTEVAGDYDGVVLEEFMTDYPRRLLNSYEVTKSEAEEYLRQQIETGLPTTIFRPSMVVGEATTGKTTRFGSFYYLLSDMVLARRSAIMPGSQTLALDTVPVDFLAQAVVALLEDADAVGKVYHPTAGSDAAIPLYEFVQTGCTVLRDSIGVDTRPPHFAPAGAFRALLKSMRPLSMGHLRKWIDNQLILLEFFFLNTRFDNRQLRQAVEKHGLHLPRFAEYFPALCRYYLEHRVGRGGVPRYFLDFHQGNSTQ